MKLYNSGVKRNLGLVLLGAFAIFMVAGCDPEVQDPGALKPIPKPDQYAQAPKPAVPVPKTTDDVLKLGIPVHPGSVIADEADSTTLDEKKYSRTYKVKMYAPSGYTDVIPTYMKGIVGGSLSGGGDGHRVSGHTKSGDEIEIMLGPAADHNKTLVMVWLTQKK